MAKTTGKISGNLIMVSREGEQVACTTGATSTLSTERIEDTCKDNGGTKTYSAGSQDGSIQVQGISKFDTASNFTAIITAWKNKTTETWNYGSLDNVDDPYIYFDGFISDLTWEGPLNAPSTWSFTVSPTSEILISNT